MTIREVITKYLEVTIDNVSEHWDINNVIQNLTNVSNLVDSIHPKVHKSQPWPVHRTAQTSGENKSVIGSASELVSWLEDVGDLKSEPIASPDFQYRVGDLSNGMLNGLLPGKFKAKWASLRQSYKNDRAKCDGAVREYKEFCNKLRDCKTYNGVFDLLKTKTSGSNENFNLWLNIFVNTHSLSSNPTLAEICCALQRVDLVSLNVMLTDHKWRVSIKDDENTEGLEWVWKQVLLCLERNLKSLRDSCLKDFGKEVRNYKCDPDRVSLAQDIFSRVQKVRFVPSTPQTPLELSADEFQSILTPPLRKAISWVHQHDRRAAGQNGDKLLIPWRWILGQGMYVAATDESGKDVSSLVRALIDTIYLNLRVGPELFTSSWDTDTNVVTYVNRYLLQRLGVYAEYHQMSASALSSFMKKETGESKIVIYKQLKLEGSMVEIPSSTTTTTTTKNYQFLNTPWKIQFSEKTNISLESAERIITGDCWEKFRGFNAENRDGFVSKLSSETIACTQRHLDGTLKLFHLNSDIVHGFKPNYHLLAFLEQLKSNGGEITEIVLEYHSSEANELGHVPAAIPVDVAAAAAAAAGDDVGGSWWCPGRCW